MVVVLILYSSWKFARHTRCPYDDSLLAVVVPEEFGSPYVDGGGVGHDLDETLLAPVL